MPSLIDGKYNFSINGVSYAAKNMTFGWESLASEDSGRTLDGVMHIYWVLNKIRKIEITMPPCTYTTIASIINAVQGKTYILSYYDPALNAVRNIEVYTSNAKTDMYSGVIRNGLYENFTFHAIEIAGDTN